MPNIMTHHSPAVVTPMKAELSNDNQSVVFFDLETTGLGQTCEIVQLAAVSGGNSINLYTVPRGRMQRGAARVTGFRVRRRGLFLHRQPVLTNSLREVVVSFIAFLRMLGRPVLVGHNIRRFDCPLLARALDELDLRGEFRSTVTGCVDTLPLARDICKDYGLRSFRQEDLVRELLGARYEAHDALEDVRALQSLYRALRPTSELISRHFFTLETMVQRKHSPNTMETMVQRRRTPKPAPTVLGQFPLWEHFGRGARVPEHTTHNPGARDT